MNLSFLRTALTFLAFMLALSACSSDGATDDRPVVIFDNFDGGILDGCVQPAFPENQPDLSVLSPPVFLLTNSTSLNSSTGQAEVDPEETIDAEIAVNAATRQMRVELVDVYSPRNVIDQADVQTGGSETIPLEFASPPSVRGRFYLKVTLCTDDCRDMQAVYETVACLPGVQLGCGVNGVYQRTLFLDGEVTQVDETCIDFDANPGIGSGTVVIQ